MIEFLGRYCGNGKVPGILMTSGYRMLVIYKSTLNQLNHQGFKASYEGISIFKFVILFN